ncbi:thiosulfate dehydrogenase [quinone] large subunit [Mesobacillus persicus]|uniref:Thiosulfate dehydrogenase [quinone] large subunit n=1 Tax=Mesobacillus persicus TaxID=930146 RepID=A0A1H7Z6G6_9BACI|nr:DoxX family protein [Mesobacillus persicus]SEM54202.1 thiosulfate dehydrogenase [quinone] large subunit [Mesobacillus persicus]
MFATFLRENKIAAGILTVIRLYLGYAWMVAGWGKLTGGFDASGYLNNAVANPVKGPDGNAVYGWYVNFLEAFAIPNVGLFNFIVPLGEFLVGVGLLLGCLTTAAMFFGLVMNFSFFLAGTVSHNPTDIFLGGIILFAGYNAGRYGLDRWVIPFIRKTINKKAETNTLSKTA